MGPGGEPGAAAPADGAQRAPRALLAAAVAVIAIGTALRILGVDCGLPFIYDPDEPDFVNRAFRMLETGNLDPGWFGHPGSTTMYSFFLVFAGYAASLGTGIAGIAAEFRAEPSAFFLLARLVVVAFAAGTMALTWHLGRRVAGPWGALLAVAVMAVAPLHTQFSRVARPDMQMSFLVLASVACAVAVAAKGRWRDYLLAGFFIGLAVATKYPSLVFALVIVLAHAARQVDGGRAPWAGFPRLAGAGAAAAAGAFVGSPYLFLSPGVAFNDIVREARSYHLSGTSEGFWSSLNWYLSGTMLTEVGIVGAALVLAGAWAAIRRRNRGGLLALASLVLFVVFMSTLTLRWDRWMLPAVPFACVLAALGIVEVHRTLASRWPGRAAAVVAGALGLVAVTLPAMTSVPWTVAVSRGDSRDFAWQWIMDNVPPGSRILGEAYTPQLPPERYRLYAVAEGQVWRLDAGGRRFAVPQGIIGTLGDASAVARAGIDYVVIANHYDRRLEEPGRYQRQIGIYEDIMSGSELVFETDAAPWVAIGLPVRIYRVRR